MMLSTLTTATPNTPAHWSSFDVDTLAEWAGLPDQNIDPDSALGLLLRATRDEFVDVVIDRPGSLTDPVLLLMEQKKLITHAVDTAGFDLYGHDYSELGQAPHWIVIRLMTRLVRGMLNGSLVIPR